MKEDEIRSGKNLSVSLPVLSMRSNGTFDLNFFFFFFHSRIDHWERREEKDGGEASEERASPSAGNWDHEKKSAGLR